MQNRSSIDVKVVATRDTDALLKKTCLNRKKSSDPAQHLRMCRDQITIRTGYTANILLQRGGIWNFSVVFESQIRNPTVRRALV